MRAAFQILGIPFRIKNGKPEYSVFCRADDKSFQFVAGGGENDETPLEAAKREILEESGITPDNIIELTSLSYLPVTIIHESLRRHWDKNIYVIPEYTFGYECDSDILISHEHLDILWLNFDEAYKKLTWDSNRTALYELNERLKNYDL